MTTSSFGVRKLKPNRKEAGVRNDCLFSVNRGPVTPQKRDVSQFEDYRQRAFIESMKDAFRTISFRSEPTIGEESLTRRCKSRREREVHGQVSGKNGYPVMHKKCDELVQNLVPDCYEHIQNFHHYRSDMARLNSGFKVLYLSDCEKDAKNETADLRGAYGQKSKGPKENVSISGLHQMFPGRMFRSTRMANTVSKKAVKSTQKGRDETKNSKTKSKKPSTRPGARLDGKYAQRTNAASTESSFNKEQQLSCEDDQGEFNTKSDNELPCFKLEHAPVSLMENQASFHSLVSDSSQPKPPMTTPDDMSRRSSIRTLVFESGDDFTNRERNRASSPRNSIYKDSDRGHHYLAPFNSRFPHLKASSDCCSFQTRQKRCGDARIPPWQQYRILCDAFRPNISAERGLYQKNYSYNGYKKPKFATATELEYYIDVVSETNNYSIVHMS